MTSKAEADALLRKLNFVGDDVGATSRSAGFRFVVDFDSSLVWPDLPFDTSSPASRYADDGRPLIVQTLERAERIFATRAPKAWDYIDEHLDQAMVRRSDAVDGASSSSNRALIGVCLLTNLHVPSDRVAICIEALVHETIHQYLYRTERDHGNFCDLGAPGRFRSPWSGNRIPLHSLVHASLVWFGLLSLWCQLGSTFEDNDEATLTRNRVAPTLFGFAYIRQLIEKRSFPRNSIEPGIIDLIERMTDIATSVAGTNDAQRTLAASLRRSEEGEWTTDLRKGLERIEALSRHSAP